MIFYPLLFSTILLSCLLLVFFLKHRSLQKKISLLSLDKTNYETICHEANDAMLVIDIVDGKIHKANPALAVMLGYSIDQLTHLSLFDLHPKNLLEKSSVVIADVWEKGGLVYQDIPFVKANGELLPVECSAKVMRYGDRPAALIYARDITERLKMEKEIRIKNELIEEKNKNITDSIRYAKRIQDSLLPLKTVMDGLLPGYFVLFKPKDIVSGDFFWVAPLPSKRGNFTTQADERDKDLEHTNDLSSSVGIEYSQLPPSGGGGAGALFACCDCTGHGVPGAFVSFMAHHALNKAVTESVSSEPAKILDKVNEIMVEQFSKSEDEIKDGMDIALCALELPAQDIDGVSEMPRLHYAGANNSMYLIRNGELKEIKADKQPIGKYSFRKNFTNNSFPLQKGDTVYLFSDGYADQFGGPKGKKFKYARFEKLLTSIQQEPMAKQREILENTIEEWKGALEQVDDICILAIRI